MLTRWDLEQLLTDLEKQCQLVNNQLARCPEGTLQHTYRDRKQVFFQAINESGRRKRVSISRRHDLIDSLARKKYLETESSFLLSNMNALETMLAHYVDITPDIILQSLPQRYRDLPEDRFFAAYHDPVEMEKKFREWAEEPFEQSTYRPWEKTHTTIRGLKVRSKSEVIISERLDIHSLPARYEQMLYFQQYSFSPDFTILTRHGLKYWEHCGKVNDPEYMRHHKWKMTMYDRMGIVPWKNLIVTYDTVEGGIDSRIIESEIINKLL